MPPRSNRTLSFGFRATRRGRPQGRRATGEGTLAPWLGGRQFWSDHAPRRFIVGARRQYTVTVARDERVDETAVRDALRRQIEDPEDHDASLIEVSLRLTPEQRLQRLTTWVAFVASAHAVEGLTPGGRD